MTRTPNPRFIADLQLAVEISAANEEEAEQRLDAALGFVIDRLDRTTFKRLAGSPAVVHSDICSDVVPV